MISIQRPVTVSAAVLVTPAYVAKMFTVEFDERLCVLTVNRVDGPLRKSDAVDRRSPLEEMNSLVVYMLLSFQDVYDQPPEKTRTIFLSNDRFSSCEAT